MGVTYKQWCAGIVIAGLAALTAQAETAADAKIQVREGYKLTVAIPKLEGARFMKLTPEGILFVSRPKQGDIQACRDKDGDGEFETITTFVKGFPSCHGLEWHKGELWFSQTEAIHKAKDTNNDGVADDVKKVLGDDILPKGGGHWWRSLLIHKDRVYTSLGDAGNIEDMTDSKRQKIWSYKLDGSDEQLFCTGIRNTEKLVVRPETEEIWGMDHGSDMFGGVMERRGLANGENPTKQPFTDHTPPEEMNHYVQDAFYGHPFIIGKMIPRYEYMDREDIVELATKTTIPEWCGGAHWAANAMLFYNGPHAKGDAFVAYHGSWNSSKKVGYAVTRVLFEKGKPYGEQMYARFVDDEGNVYGRPVDVAEEPSGSILISDDQGGKIFRLSAAK